MSFFVYFAVIVVAAASALFGLDLLTAPLPDKPPTQVSSTQAPNKLAQREANKNEANAQQAGKDDSVLTPVLPTAPGGSKDVRMVYPPTNETTGAAGASDKSAPVQTTGLPSSSSTPAAVQSEQNAVVQSRAPVQPLPQQEAAASIAAPAHAESALATQPAVQQSGNRCDVAACAASYNSFRAADCTYQPFDGPRRICEKASSTQRSAERPAIPRMEPRLDRAARGARKDAELRAVSERVKVLTSTRDDFDEDIDDAPVRSRRVIVIERDDGWR